MNSTDDTAHKQISTVINRFLCSGMYLMDAPHVRQYNSIQMWNEQYKRKFGLVLVSFQNKNCFSIFIFILFLSFNFTYTHTLTGRSCSTNNLSFASEQWIAIVFFFILLCLLMFVGFSVPFSTKLLLFDSCFFLLLFCRLYFMFSVRLCVYFSLFNSFVGLQRFFFYVSPFAFLVFALQRVPILNDKQFYSEHTIQLQLKFIKRQKIEIEMFDWNLLSMRQRMFIEYMKGLLKKTMFVTTTIIDLARLIIRIDAWEFVIFSLHSIANDIRNRSCLLFSTLLAVYWS